MLRRRLKFNLIKFLRLKGAPGKLALGFAVGACVNFYPTFGFGVPLAGVVAAVFLANVPAGLLGDIIFKPLFPFFFYMNMVTGYLVWTSRLQDVRHLWRVLLQPKSSTFAEVSKVFFAGAVINSLITGTILYICIYLMVKRYRLRVLKWLVGKNRRKSNCV